MSTCCDVANASGDAVDAIWLAAPADFGAAALAACHSVLDGDERARAARFHFDVHRREFIVAHALVRTALSHATGRRPPAAWRFAYHPEGRPAAVDCAASFNLTTHPSLVACAIGRGREIGIDLEPRSRADIILPIAAEAFSPAERAQLAALAENSPGAAGQRAVALWTFKEAYLKAIGVGLARRLDSFSIAIGERVESGFDTARVIVHDGSDDGARWLLRGFAVADHRIAVACPGTPAPATLGVELRWWRGGAS